MNRKIACCLLVALSAGVVACSGQREEPVRVPPQPSPLEESRPQTAVANAANEFSGSFRALNRSGVRGDVLVRVDGDSIVVRMTAKGLGRGRHPVGVHGFADGRLSHGPPSAASVTKSELERFTGPELLALAPFAGGGSGSGSGEPYSTRLNGRAAFPLDIRAIVIFAGSSGAERVTPVAYALLKPAELGDGGTGGPGDGASTGGAGAASMGVPGAGSGSGSGASPDSGAGSGGGGGTPQTQGGQAPGETGSSGTGSQPQGAGGTGASEGEPAP